MLESNGLQLKLSKEDIDELQSILQDDYGVSSIEEKELIDIGLSFVELGREIYKEFKRKKRNYDDDSQHNMI